MLTKKNMNRYMHVSCMGFEVHQFMHGIRSVWFIIYMPEDTQ